MSSRDWSTIGAQGTLPRWVPWAIPPLLIPLASMVPAAVNWQLIPIKFGHPLVTRTPLHVFGFFIFAEGMAILLVGLMVMAWYGSGRPAVLEAGMKAALAAAYLLSLVFTGIGLSQVTKVPAWITGVAAPVAALLDLVYMAGLFAEDGAPDPTPKECWILGGIYYNPNDPALAVKARAGHGFTFNMANSWSRRIVVGFIAGVGVLVGFLIWALR